MPRGRRTRTLAELEAQLHKVNAERARIIDDIQAAVRNLHLTSSPLLIGVEGGGAYRATRRAGGPRRRMSPAARAKLRAAAKRRWAEAKKAGKTRLG